MDTVIQEGDDYQLLWSIDNQKLFIYPGCTQADLPTSSAYTDFNFASGANIDIKHIVNGAYKTFTVNSPYETALDKLSKVSAGTWCRYAGNGVWQVVGENDPFPLNETIFATRYPVTLNSPEHGSISINTQYSDVMQEGNQVYGMTGNIVRLAYKADSDYVLDAITVTDASGAVINLYMSGNWYCFDMPGSAATVTAAFRKEGEYRITVAKAEHGSISVTQSTAQKDKEIQVTAAPDENYHLACLKVAYYSAESGDRWDNTWYNYGVTGYSFTMPESDVTLTPTFLPNTLYNITITPSTGGTVTASHNSACEHDRIRLTITPDEGYELDQRTITGIGDEELIDETEFFMGTNDVTVTATFKLKKGYYTIGVNQSDKGSLSVPAAAKGGSTVTFTVAPEEGYYLGQLVVDYVETAFDDVIPNYFSQTYNSYDTTYTFTMPRSNATLTPYFLDKTAYSISVQNGANGTVAANVTSACWKDEIWLTITPDTYYQLKSLQVKDKNDAAVNTTKKSDTLYTFSMPVGNVTVTAEFKLRSDCYHISTSTEHGTINVQSIAKVGETVPFTITPDSGYVLDGNSVELTRADGIKYGWVSDASGNYSFTMPACDVNLSASFKAYYTATIITTGGDENCKAWLAFPVVTDNTYFAGTQKTLSIQCSDGCHKLKSVSIVDADGNEIPFINDEDFKFNAPASDITITVEFVRAYAIAINGAENGRVVANPVKGSAGESIKLTVSPEHGYQLASIEIKDAQGNLIPVMDSHFTMPACDVTITAAFEAVPAGEIIFTVIPGDSAAQQTGTIETSQTFAAWAEGKGFSTESTYWRVQRSSGMMETVTDSTMIQNGDIYTRVAKATEIGTIVYAPCTAEELPNDTYRVVLAEVCEGGRISVTHSVDGKDVTFVLTGRMDIFNAFLANNLDPYLTWRANSQNVNTSAAFPLNKTVFTSVPNSGMYPIAAETREGKGTVTVNGKTSGSFAAGTTITVSVTPANGYKLQSLIVRPLDAYHQNETPISLTEQNTFIMPARQVMVEVRFVPSAPSYTITIPSAVSLNDVQSMTIAVSNVQNLNGQSIHVAVTSENGGKLKSGEYEMTYSFTESLNFTEDGGQDFALTIGEDEAAGKPAGTYTDTLHFSVSLTDAAGE